MNYLSKTSELEAIYSAAPTLASTAKETGQLTAEYRALIAASPFLALATVGPEGLDCSPRGDRPGFVRVLDDKTLAIPDRQGNNRIDSLRNIIREPRVALMFLIPGSGTTFRVNGTARITADEDFLESFAVEGKSPRSAIIIAIEACYFQCARAVARSELWNPARHVDPASLPTPGEILEALTSAEIQGKAYDSAWLERAKKSLW